MTASCSESGRIRDVVVKKALGADARAIENTYVDAMRKARIVTAIAMIQDR